MDGASLARVRMSLTRPSDYECPQRAQHHSRRAHPGGGEGHGRGDRGAGRSDRAEQPAGLIPGPATVLERVRARRAPGLGDGDLQRQRPAGAVERPGIVRRAAPPHAGFPQRHRPRPRGKVVRRRHARLASCTSASASKGAARDPRGAWSLGDVDDLPRRTQRPGGSRSRHRRNRRRRCSPATASWLAAVGWQAGHSRRVADHHG